jgi:hypothetical protein
MTLGKSDGVKDSWPLESFVSLGNDDIGDGACNLRQYLPHRLKRNAGIGFLAAGSHALNIEPGLIFNSVRGRDRQWRFHRLSESIQREFFKLLPTGFRFPKHLSL